MKDEELEIVVHFQALYRRVADLLARGEEAAAAVLQKAADRAVFSRVKEVERR